MYGEAYLWRCAENENCWGISAVSYIEFSRDFASTVLILGHRQT
jgi:hypothetical protein